MEIRRDGLKHRNILSFEILAMLQKTVESGWRWREWRQVGRDITRIMIKSILSTGDAPPRSAGDQ